MKAAYYKDHGHLMMLVGDDFQWAHASFNYFNIDKLIKYVNNKNTSLYTLRYSTASEYFEAINQR